MPMTPSIQSRLTTALRLQQALGALGALLAFAILAASILLRLTSVIDDSGVHSTLAANTENAVRMVHRLSASGVGLLALLAVGIGWAQRKVAPHAVRPVVWIVTATVLLAVIGPLTPGYRFNSVTVANVVGGTVLLAACWWLREALACGPWPEQARQHPLLRATVAVLAVHVGLGAAASALEMRGTHWVAFVHSGSAMLTALLLSSILWDRRGDAHLGRIVAVLAGALALQLLLGLLSLWVEGRPVALGFVHAMLSALLAGGLVSFAVRDGQVLTPKLEN